MFDAAEEPVAVTASLEATLVSAPETVILSDAETDTDAVLIVLESVVDELLDRVEDAIVVLLSASEVDALNAEMIDADVAWLELNSDCVVDVALEVDRAA